MRHLLFYLFAILSFVTIDAQIGELTYGGPGRELSNTVVQMANSRLLVGGATKSFAQEDQWRAYLVYTTHEGETIWDRTYDDYYNFRGIFPAADGSFKAFMPKYGSSSNLAESRLSLVSFNMQGEITSEVEFDNFDLRGTLETSDDNYLVIGQRSINTDGCGYTAKISPTGELLWSDCRGRIENDYAWRAIEDNEGNYIVGGISYRPGIITGSESMVTKYNASGEVQWEVFLGPEIEHGYYVGGIAQMSNGNYMITHLDQDTVELAPYLAAQMNILVQEISASTGEVLQSYEFERNGRELPTKLIPDGDNGFYCLGYRDLELGGKFNLDLIHISEDLEVEELANYGGLLDEFAADMTILDDDRLAILGRTNSFGYGEYDMYLVLTDEMGFVETNRIEGKVAHDTIQNCLVDNDEQGLDRWVVAVEGSAGTTYGLTFSGGHYSIPVNTGSYQVSTQEPSSYWLPCFESVPADVATSLTIADLPVQAEILCPDLATNVTTYFLEPCAQAAIVEVNYANWGTAAADSAYIDITFDTVLTVTDLGDLPGTSLGNNVYRYDLGQLDINAQGFFRVIVDVSCDLEEDQAVLLESQIYPDTICGPDGNFNGAVLELGARCTGDEVELTITNIGEDIMMGPQNYIVIEDAVLRETAPVTLEPDQALTLTYDATGTTFTLSIPQEPGAPGTTLLSTVVEGCQTLQGGGTATRGLTNQLPLEEDGLQSTAQFYFPSAAPTDFFNGTAFPNGFGPDHVVSPNTRIAYSLPFDFRSFDSLSAILLVVEPSPHLDLRSLRLEESSHPFQALIGAGNTLEFYFDNLPGRDAEQPGQGYINFSMGQKADLPVGTQIVNLYALQIDFNEEITIGQSFHTVGNADLTVIVSDDLPTASEEVLIKAFPNPFVDRVQFQWENLPKSEEVSLEIYDANGRLIDSASAAYVIGGNLSWDRGNIPAGVYQFVFSQGNEILQTGRILAH
ncbi:MAG: T9SS type A sorting domain-containing protein [Bacteroidota bacterium]